MNRRTRSRSAADVGLILLFLVGISLPVTRNLLGSPPASSGDEVRDLTPPPEWKPSRSFPSKFESFYNDQFGFRATLIRWVDIGQVLWLKVSSSPRVILGKEGWLFLSPMPVGQEYVHPFADAEAASWTRMFQARRDWLAARGIRYLLVVAPEKQSIYPEALPRAFRSRYAIDTRFDRLLTFLRTHTDIPVLDLREPLRQAKCRERLYDRTDSHWNGRGAYVAYCALLEALAPWFPGMQALPRTEFVDVSLPGKGKDCARLLGLTNFLTEENLVLAPRRSLLAQFQGLQSRLPLQGAPGPYAMIRPGVPLPRAVMFHDSFGGHLVSLLQDHFQRIVFAWERLDYPVFDTALMEQEHPEVVIQEMVEWKLLLYCPRPDAAALGDAVCEKPEAWWYGPDQ